MSKFFHSMKKCYENFVSIFLLLACAVGFVGGFVLWAVAPQSGIWGIDKEQIAIAPILLPLLLFTVGQIFNCVIRFVAGTVKHLQRIKSQWPQILLTSIFIIGTLTLFFVIFNSWKSGYWEDATKYGNNGGIGDIVADMFYFASEDVNTTLVCLGIEISISIALVLSLYIVNKKYVKQFFEFLSSLSILAITVFVSMFLLNCVIYTVHTTFIFAYSFMLALVLLPSWLMLSFKTCPCCYHYNCGKTLLSTHTETSVDYDHMQVVSSTDHHYEDDTTITVQTVSPKTTTNTISTYKCKRCKMTFSNSKVRLFKF